MTAATRLLLGTTNSGKAQRLAQMLSDLPLTLLTAAELGIRVNVRETGTTPEQNARLKATAFCAASGEMTLADDAGLWLNGLSAEEQPGVWVRRRGAGGRALDDARLVRHFATVVADLGGQTDGTWQIGVAIAQPGGKLLSTTVSSATRFVAQPASVIPAGQPLRALQVAADGRYLADLSTDELTAAQGRRASDLIRFVRHTLAL
jgi:XTP/dITP diphosphohydrolase